MHRRTMIGSTAAALFTAQCAAPAQAADDAPFDAQTVRNLARTLAASSYKAPDTKLPDALAQLSYDDYRQIRFDPNQSLWRGAKLPI